MEAFQNTPLGYEVRSRSNTPILTSPDNSAESSMHGRDAKLQIILIASLIQENQSPKSESRVEDAMGKSFYRGKSDIQLLKQRAYQAC